MSTEALIEVTIGGLGLGSIYATVAIGFVIVYKTTRVLNFAHGTLGAAGGLILASLLNDGGLGIGPLAGANPLRSLGDTLWGWTANLALAMVLAALLGMAVERFVIRPMSGRSPFALLMATVAVSIAFQTVIDRAPIARGLSIPWGSDTWTIGDGTVAVSSVAAIVVGLCSVLALAAINRTRYGLSARAVASDQEAALAQGINVGRVTSLTWALAAAMATAAAVAFSFSPNGRGAIVTGLTPGLFFRALPVLALGGWDSYTGAYLGGLTIGLLQVGVGRAASGHVDLLGAGYPTILPYLLMVVVLLARPAGIFGQRTIRRV